MTRRILATAGLLFGGALFLAGCSSISSGTVTGKTYEPGFFLTTTVCSGQPVICTPILSWIPECYRLDLDDGKDTGDVCVSEEDYAAYRAGDHYPRAR